MVTWKTERGIFGIYLLFMVLFSSELNPVGLSILGLLPITRFMGPANLTAGVLPAIQLALEHLISHPSILKDYELQLTFTDTQVQ